MAAKPIEKLGAGGVVKDTPAVQLPENVFTDIQNMRIRNSSVETQGGDSLFDTATTGNPEYGFHWRRPDQGYNIFLNDGIGWRTDAGSSEALVLNSVDAKYTDSIWQTDYFNGGYAVIINNGKSNPLYMLYGSASAGSTFQEFPNWNYGGFTSIYAKVIRPLGYSLVAANFTIVDAGITTNAPSTIRISVQAATGQFPTIWEPGLTTDTADEFEINSTSPILDMRELRGNMYVYSSDSIHMLSIRGGNSQVTPYSESYGVLNVDCVCEFDGKHFVVDRNDIYQHNGSGKIDSLVEGRVKDYFFSRLDATGATTVRVVKNPRFNEIWVCYHDKDVVSHARFTHAMIYNYKADVWYFRDLGAFSSVVPSFRDGGSTFDYSRVILLGISAANTSVMRLDDKDSEDMWDGNSLKNQVSFVEREKLTSGDFSQNVQINSLYIVVDNNTNSVDVTVTGQQRYKEAVDFTNTSGRDTTELDPDDLDDSSSYKVDSRQKGRFLNYHMEAVGAWRLAAMAIDGQPADKR